MTSFVLSNVFVQPISSVSRHVELQQQRCTISPFEGAAAAVAPLGKRVHFRSQVLGQGLTC